MPRYDSAMFRLAKHSRLTFSGLALVLAILALAGTLVMLRFMGATFVVGVIVTLLVTIGARALHDLRQKAEPVTRFGQYVLDEKIGEGGHGAVYRGQHALLRRPAAIKIVRPDQLDP